jgi:peptidyl-prolyl cis-trans isomerase C
MKRVLQLGLLIVLVAMTARVATAISRPDEVAVIVNGEPIYMWEIGLLLPQIQAEMEMQGFDPRGRDLIAITVRRAVDSRLLAQEARRRGIEPDRDRIDKKTEALANSAGGGAELEAELIKSNITYEQFLESVVQSDLAQSLTETEIIPGIHVTQNDIERFYAENPDLFKEPDRIHSRHILILVDADADADEKRSARIRAEEARRRAMAGEDFAELAVELSEGPNADKGGDLGFTLRGQMVEDFDDAVWALEPGEISEVVESRLGYHVIKVEEIVIGPSVPLEAARPAIVDLLRQRRTTAALASFVAELRAQAEIISPEE